MKKNSFIFSILGMVLMACNQEPKPLQGEKIKQETTAEVVQNQALTALALSENHFNFGKIKKGEKVEHNYEVTNMGEVPLIIAEVKPGCGCTAPDFTKTPILPGEKGNIILSFDSSNFEGLVSKQAVVFANVEKSPITLTFTAEIEP